MMRIQLLTLASQAGDSDSPSELFATALRGAGVETEVAPFEELKPASLMLWEFGGIAVQGGSPLSAYQIEMRAMLKSDDLGAVFLVNTASGPRSLKLVDDLGLAGTIELHDCWQYSLPANLAQAPSRPCGFIGRTELLEARYPLLSTHGAYSKCDLGSLPIPLVGLADYLARYEATRRKP